MRRLDPGLSRRTGRLLRASLAAALVAVALGAGQASAAPDGQSMFAGVRAATAAYHDLSVAEAAGYGLFPGCFTNPAGGMGVHYVQFSSVADGIVDPLQPEALVYEPLGDGAMRLVAVEYVAIAAAWDAAHPGQAPTVFGKPLEFVPEPNEFGLPPFYELHVWLWQPNPSGIFSEWNPSVSCPSAG
jgi:hypothetical protein